MAKIVKEQKMFNGWVRKFKHNSTATKTEMTFSVFFPPAANENKAKNLPVLFYLSGLTCTDDNFITKSFAQKSASDNNIVLVAPDTSPRGLNLPKEHDSYDFGCGAGFYLDSSVEPYSDHYNMFSYVTEELFQLLSTDIAFESLDMSNASVMGHSMGGHGALVCGLKTSKFKSISAFAPICNPINCPWGTKAFEGYLSKREEWENYDATCLVEKYKTKGNLNILIDQGTNDEFYVKKQLLPEAFVKACDKNKENVSVDLRFQDGYDHSYFFIASFVEDHILFHSKYLSK